VLPVTVVVVDDAAEGTGPCLGDGEGDHSWLPEGAVVHEFELPLGQVLELVVGSVAEVFAAEAGFGGKVLGSFLESVPVDESEGEGRRGGPVVEAEVAEGKVAGVADDAVAVELHLGDAHLAAGTLLGVAFEEVHAEGFLQLLQLLLPQHLQAADVLELPTLVADHSFLHHARATHLVPLLLYARLDDLHYLFC